MDTSSMPPRALDDVRVIDLSRVLAGPLATMILGDLGADIIKVERPGSGDDTRSWRPPVANDEATYFLGLNRNKRGVVLDLNDAADLEVLHRLIATADVVVDNFRPGVMARFSLDHATLSAAHPGIITCSVTGFGDTGPAAALPGYDVLLQGMTGLMSITGEPDGPPLKVGSPLIDKICGLYAATGILAAIHHRERTGLGQHVAVSLFDAGLSALLNQGSAYALAGEVPGRIGNRHPSIAPYQAFEAADGMLMVAAGNQAIWVRLCEVLEVTELVDDPRFLDSARRVINIDVLDPILTARFRTRPVSHWVERLSDARVPAGPVNDIAQAIATAERLELEPLWEDARGQRHIRSPLRMSLTPPQVTLPPPLLDEHGDEVRASVR
jgi:crotonobetainyl-CoA:carnitine CoA-transferase CaiB-like acyl-CoA transferase